MQKLHHVRPQVNIKAANRPFPEKYRDDELSKIDTENAAHIADEVCGNQRESTPGEDDDHGVALKDLLQFLHTRSVLFFEYIIEMQGFRKIVDTHGRNQNSRKRQREQWKRREDRDGEKNQAGRWNERETASASDQQVRYISGDDGGRHGAAQFRRQKI